jgi:hypothetical protein
MQLSDAQGRIRPVTAAHPALQQLRQLRVA